MPRLAEEARVELPAPVGRHRDAGHAGMLQRVHLDLAPEPAVPRLVVEGPRPAPRDLGPAQHLLAHVVEENLGDVRLDLPGPALLEELLGSPE